MSEGIIERLRYEAAVRPNALSSIYPGDVLEVIDELIAWGKATEAALADRDRPCYWSEGSDEVIVWNSACGQAEYFECGGPDENSYQFCPYCGHRIEVQL